MSDPSRLSISVQHADGSQSRWGYGEAQASDIPLGLSFSTALPGGFKDCSFNLPRLLTREYNDEALFDQVTVYGPGNTVAWQGRVQQLPREQGGRASVQVGAVGLSSALKDAPLLNEIYVDQDKSRWTPPSLARQANLTSGSITVSNDVSVIWDGAEPALQLNITGAWSRAIRCEAWYDAEGIPLGRIACYVKAGNNTGAADAGWDYYVSLSTDDLVTTTDQTNASPVGSGTAVAVAATASNRKYARLRFHYNAGAAGSAAAPYSLWFTNVAVYGYHGLTLRGTATTTQGQGVYASDVIRDVLARCAPSLPIAQIDDSAFIIPQLTFKGVTAEDAILEVTKYHLYPWGVYEDGFFWKQNNESTSTVYEARLSEGAQMSLEGDDASATYNGVIVSYTDADGKERVAAPPGVTYADYTSSDLLSSDPNNPATLHGLTRYGQLRISSPLPNTNADGDNPAIQIGRMWLAEASLPQRRGSITLPAMVRHPTEGMIPSWRVRAGDWIKMADRPGDVARRIVSTSYSEDGRTMTLDVGGLPAKVEALLEAIGVQMVGIA